MRIPRFCFLLLIIVSAAFEENSIDRAYVFVRNNDLTALRSLTKEGLNERDAEGQTPLMFAAAFGSLDAMKLLIANGADAKTVSEAGVTALHLAVGDARKARLLLENGADVNKPSCLGGRPCL